MEPGNKRGTDINVPAVFGSRLNVSRTFESAVSRSQVMSVRAALRKETIISERCSIFLFCVTISNNFNSTDLCKRRFRLTNLWIKKKSIEFWTLQMLLEGTFRSLKRRSSYPFPTNGYMPLYCLRRTLFKVSLLICLFLKSTSFPSLEYYFADGRWQYDEGLSDENICLKK